MNSTKVAELCVAVVVAAPIGFAPASNTALRRSPIRRATWWEFYIASAPSAVCMKWITTAQLAPWSAVASVKRDTAFGLPSDSEDAEKWKSVVLSAGPRSKRPASPPPSPTQSKGGVAPDACHRTPRRRFAPEDSQNVTLYY
ncbi:hypothetical protein ACXR0O_25780 [Verrucomicrobiota bacterium sgz303538]